MLKSDQGSKVSPQINSFDAAPNNLDPPVVSDLNPHSKDISDDAKRQLLVDLGLIDNDVLLEEGGEGFKEEVQNLISSCLCAFWRP